MTIHVGRQPYECTVRGAALCAINRRRVRVCEFDAILTVGNLICGECEAACIGADRNVNTSIVSGVNCLNDRFSAVDRLDFADFDTGEEANSVAGCHWQQYG